MMMHCLTRMMPSRMVFAMLAAAIVFTLASGTLGGYEGNSYALTAPGEPLPGGTPDTTDLKTTGPNGQLRSCGDFEEAKGGYLLGRIVPCLTKTIEHGASRMSREMIKLLRPTLYAFLTFVIVIFGVQIMQNEGQLQTRAFVLLLKIGFCFAILAAIPGDKDTDEGGLIGTAYGIMAETQAAVMSTLGPDFGNIHCAMEKFGDENTPLIWKQMDCLISKLAGFTVGTPGPSGEARPNMLLASSVVGMLGGFFFSGSFGVALFLACIGMLVSMFVLILRVLVAFLNSYMFIGLYMILAPLLLPLMFLKVTSSMFEKWYSGILASLLLPMVICGYVVIAMQVYDKLFFADDAMITKLFNNDIMDRARQLPQSMNCATVANNPDLRAAASGQETSVIYNNPLLQNINPLVAASNSLCGGMTKPNLVIDGTFKGADGKTLTAKQAFEELFYDCLKLFILSMLINMGFNTVMSAVRPMLGSGAVVAALDTGTKTEAKFKQSMASARQEFQDSFYDKDGRSTSGAAFLRQIPGAFGSSANAFLSGMTEGGIPRGKPGAAGTTPAAGTGDSGKGTGPASSGGDSGGGSSGGDNDGPDDKGGSGGGGGNTPRGGPGSGPSGAPAKTPVRSASATERREAAEQILSAQDFKRFEELEQTIERGGLPADRLAALQEEYERLLDRIDQG